MEDIYQLTQRREFSLNKEKEYRTPFEKDKSRIIHSDAFRRLQSKTQVLQTSESDFHRNRLTHSHEVAQIGRSISRFIEVQYQKEITDNFIELDHDLIETICLAHDIGHPPFGHGGEIALNYMMRDYGGFEGNAQTLRILSKLGKYSENQGMNLTRRSLLGILKYPCSYQELWNSAQNRVEVARYHELNQEAWEPPKCFYADDLETVLWILETFPNLDRELFRSWDPIKHKALFKSLDCSIMDLADDISYAVHDFEDGLELGILKHNAINALLEIVLSNDAFLSYLKSNRQLNEQDIQQLHKLKNPKQFISKCIDFFIIHVELQKNVKFINPYFAYNVKLNEKAQLVLNAFMDIVSKNIIWSPHAQQLVKNGQIIICYLFDVFEKNHKLLPWKTQSRLQEAAVPQRVICDYISGMTDRYALKMYEKIFGSKVISFFEK